MKLMRMPSAICCRYSPASNRDRADELDSHEAMIGDRAGAKLSNSRCTNCEYNGTVHLVDIDNNYAGFELDECERKLIAAKHFRKTVAIVFLLLIAVLANDISIVWIHERVPLDVRPMPDIWFSIFPEYPWAIRITEYLIFVQALWAICILLLQKHRWICLRRVLFVTALVYFGRALCFSVTQISVPSTHTYCGPQLTTGNLSSNAFSLLLKRVAWIFTGLGLDLHHRRVLCGDLIYSGHTVTLAISYLTISQYTPKRFRQAARLLALAVVCIGAVCILMARKHYTLDVILAYYVATRTFWLYQSLVEVRILTGQWQPANAALVQRVSIGNVFWYRTFEWIEEDIFVPVPVEFSLDWLQAIKSRLQKNL